MATETIFRIVFIQQEQQYEIYTREVGEAPMLGFIEASDFVFGDSSKVLVDPSQEKLKTEFNAVQRSYIPMHAVLRIDEVNREGSSKVVETKGKVSKVMPFPGLPVMPDDYR